ncbi:MAG: DDE transposase, partial [Planctomycetaceae bacterium]|nr:DDE transposase [Planctomycetaceae bacterium]
MSLGRRHSERQESLWVDAKKLGGGPRNVFYDRLNQVLAKIEFDRQLETAVEPYYQKTGR